MQHLCICAVMDGLIDGPFALLALTWTVRITLNLLSRVSLRSSGSNWINRIAVMKSIEARGSLGGQRTGQDLWSQRRTCWAWPTSVKSWALGWISTVFVMSPSWSFGKETSYFVFYSKPFLQAVYSHMTAVVMKNFTLIRCFKMQKKVTCDNNMQVQHCKCVDPLRGWSCMIE